MKRFLILFMALCLLAALLAIGSLSAHAVTHTSHCICGGTENIGDHTQCQDISWIPLSNVMTLDHVDFGKLPSGNYYLDGAVTVTGKSTLGTKSNQLSLTADTSVQILLCLNGFDITCTTSRPFGSLFCGSSLSICDCSGQQDIDGQWSWSGTVTGGYDIRGGILYSYAGSQLNIYGGNYIGTATAGGGAFVVACDQCGDVDGDGSYTENDKLLATPSVMNLYNGNITGCHVSNNGGSILLYHKAVYNMYGGTVQGGSCIKYGGNIISSPTGTLNILGGTVTGGSAQMGGNIYINGEMTLSGATVSNGTATVCNGNIFTRSSIDLSNNNIFGGKPEAVRIVNVQTGTATLSGDYTLAVALKKLTSGSYLQLSGNLEENTAISGTVYLDMNGYDLSGVTITGTLYGFDSATDTYCDGNAGKLTCTINGGQVIPHHKTDEAMTGNIRRYLTVEEEGGYSFHRFYMGLTTVTLRPDSSGMGYKAVFAGDTAVQNTLSATQAYGYTLWIDGGNTVSRGYPADRFGGTQTLTLSLNNILHEHYSAETNTQNADTQIHTVVYTRLKSGETLTSAEISYSIKDIVCKADNGFEGYTSAQQAALLEMSARHSNTFMTWDISNIHHAEGSIWTPVDQKGFIALLTKQEYYNIQEGSYVLTENVNIGSRVLNVEKGSTVTICLNGHTISSTNRTVNIHGKLNLCDCHPAASEGTVTSASAGFAPVFYVYYDACFDLYGGGLRSTRQTEHTGIGAVSHDGTDSSLPAGIMNMYGGTISGGNAINNGGLISLWNGSSFNMYGGQLSGGSAGSGGAVNVSTGCSFNLYGGSVSSNSASIKGGGFFLQNESAALNVYGGSITDNSSLLGSGVYVNKGTVNFYGGTVTENRGDGLYFLGGDVTLSGNVQITGNTGTDLNFALGGSINADGLETGSEIGLRADARCCLSNNPAVVDCFALENSFGYSFVTQNGKLMLLPEGVAEIGAVDSFSVGYSAVCIDPQDPVGLPLAGFGNSDQRLSTQILDSLFATATAITDETGNTVLIITCDLQRLPETATVSMRKDISRTTGVPFENIYISCSHTHSAPDTTSIMDVINRYIVYLRDRLTMAAMEAMADRVPASMQTSTFEIEGMNFVRHYYYYNESGEKQYVGDAFGLVPEDRSPEKFYHAAEGDHSMQLIRFNREDANPIVLCNWAAHPTMTGSRTDTNISSDYVYYLRQAVQDSENCHFAFIQGAAGNMNPTSYIDGETLYERKDYALYGQKLAQYVCASLKDMTDVPTGLIQTDQQIIIAPINHTEDNRVEDAKKLVEVYYDWQAETGAAGNAALEFCMRYGFYSIHHANSVISKASKPQTQTLEVNSFCIGSYLGFYTVPGELWAETALAIKDASPFSTTFTVGYTNVNGTYFPDGEAADGTYENYETHLSAFLFPDTTDAMKAYWQDALEHLYQIVQ